MPKPPDRLPPMDLLASFEAAARHLSFTRAAAERCVTQSAISRQIRALEDDIGAPLFTRSHRRIELTGQGRLLLAACDTALQEIRRAVGTLRAPAARRTIAVTTTPGLASLWLLPRLAAFTEAHPGIDVRVDASFAQRGLGGTGMDVAIRYAAGASRVGRKLFDETVQPVCAPGLAHSGGDLRRHTLLEVLHLSDAGQRSDWDDWASRAAAVPLEPRSTVSFPSYGDAVGAALAGQGVVLGRDPLVRHALARRSLVAPFGAAVSSGRAYFLVVPPTERRRPEVQAFEAWVLSEAAAVGRPQRRAASARATPSP